MHPWADGDAGEQRTGSVHYHDKLGDSFFCECFDYGFGVLFGESQATLSSVTPLLTRRLRQTGGFAVNSSEYATSAKTLYRTDGRKFRRYHPGSP